MKKTRVEDCLSLSAGVVSDCEGFRERIPWRGSIRWSNAATGEETAAIGFIFRPLPEGSRWDGRLRLRYTITRPGRLGEEDEVREMDYTVNMEATPCNFGGERWWFRCPLVRNGEPCGRRCFKLYEPPGANHFGCRECYELTYKSAQEAHQFDSLYEMLSDQMGVPFELVKEHFA